VNRNTTILIVSLSAVVIVVVAVVVGNAGLTAWHRAHRWDQQREATHAASDEQEAIKAAEAITPAMVGYKETRGFTVPFREPRALAVGNDDRIYVAGDRGVVIFSPEGKKLSEIALKEEPHCLVVGSGEHGTAGHIYVGMKEHVEVFDLTGERAAIWPSQAGAFFVSIAASDLEIWVADADNRVVWCYDLYGKPLTPLGKPGSAGGTDFVVTNHYFDVTMGRDLLLYVANPGLLRVEGYTRNGEREANWGKGSSAVADFFGSSNPVHLSVLPDGSFATAEQRIPRVKIYSRRGDFQTVVVGRPQLSETPAGIAGDRRGRVLVLDAKAAKVRIFEKKPEEAKATGVNDKSDRKKDTP
jgi:hypothetical protein